MKKIYFVRKVSTLDNTIMTPVVEIAAVEGNSKERLFAIQIPRKRSMVNLENSGLFFAHEIIKASKMGCGSLKKNHGKMINFGFIREIIALSQLNEGKLELYLSSNSLFLFLIEKRFSCEPQIMRDLDLISIGLERIIKEYFREKMGFMKMTLDRQFKRYSESLKTFSISIMNCLV